MALLTAFAAAGFCYPTMLLENFPYNAPPLILHMMGALGVGSLVSLLAFAGLGMAYRKKLRLREEALSQKAARLSASLSGPPPANSLPDAAA